jgi:uncharacterized protein (TIGR03503 family)
MLKSDPQNLRKPAVRLISGLIPVGSRAGMWTFASAANMEVKWGRVDDAWRLRAEQGSERIHSRGQFTNIDAALIAASSGWSSPNPEQLRSMILLTDGEVDVARDKAESIASRRKIIDKTLPRLARLGVQIHTIALSANADAALLKKIALETRGSFEIADSAEQLQRIFLRIFERATVPDTVPLIENSFEIDSSVKEMTLLVFKSSDRRTRLIAPDEKVFTQVSKVSTVKWRNDQGFDLITIKKPAAGIWKLDADVDPDNRVMVVTDLRLEVDRLPFYLRPDQSIDLRVELHNKGEKISKNSFLKFVQFSVNHDDGVNRSELPLELRPYEKVSDKGIFVQTIKAPLTEGEHRIEVIADGTTFNRAKLFNIDVKWPLDVQLKPTGTAGVYRLELTPQAEIMLPESLDASADLKLPDGGIEPIKLQSEGGGLSAEVRVDRVEGLHQVLIRYEAKDREQNPLGRELEPFPLQGIRPEPEQADTSGVEESLVESSEPEKTEPENLESTDNFWVNIGIIVIGNLILIVAGIGVVIYYRKLDRNSDLDLLADSKSKQTEADND